MMPNMTVNITCVHVNIILLTILNEPSGGRMEKEGDEKELMHM